MDQVKQAVAIAALRGASAALEQEQMKSLDGAEIEVHAISGLIIQVRVKLRVGGTRYFNVQVSEMM